MNRLSLLLCLNILIVVLVACGSPNSGNESGDQAQSTPAVPQSASDVQRITPAEAKALLDSGEAVLYDARSAAAYDALHAAGALSFPEADAAGRFGELPSDKSLVFYCTRPAEQTSARAALDVIEQGLDLAKVFVLHPRRPPSSGRPRPLHPVLAAGPRHRPT